MFNEWAEIGAGVRNGDVPGIDKLDGGDESFWAPKKVFSVTLSKEPEEAKE